MGVRMKDRLEEKLDALLRSESRPQIARLRDVFDRVERALAAGVRREAILKVLQEEGLTFTPQSFVSAVRQIRRERKAAALKAPSTPAQPQSPPTTALTPSAPVSSPAISP